jgi:hypothetical protein
VPAFDLELIDPTPAALEKAMADAVETANLRCRVGLMRLDRGEYRRFVASEFAAAAEGVAMWLADKGRVEDFPPTPRATLLGVAWRTTPLGRRIVRVAGRRIEPFREHPSNRFGPPWRRWPPLCHLDPDHVVVRTLAGGQPEAIAVCGCGAVGPPEKLGWMGGRAVRPMSRPSRGVWHAPGGRRRSAGAANRGPVDRRRLPAVGADDRRR